MVGHQVLVLGIGVRVPIRQLVKSKLHTFTLKSPVLLYPGMSGWHFVSVPQKESKKIRKEFGQHAKGWGSLPVLVTIGKTSWQTSIFPDKKSGTYLLPLKAQVRKKEEIFAEDKIRFSITIKI